jgi:hypothetical protein
MTIQNKCHIRHKPYIKGYTKHRLSSSPTHTTVMIDFSRSTPNIKPLGLHRHQWYLQPQHQHLHDHGDSNIRIGGSVSPQTQQYKTH